MFTEISSGLFCLLFRPVEEIVRILLRLGGSLVGSTCWSPDGRFVSFAVRSRFELIIYNFVLVTLFPLLCSSPRRINFSCPVPSKTRDFRGLENERIVVRYWFSSDQQSICIHNMPARPKQGVYMLAIDG